MKKLTLLADRVLSVAAGTKLAGACVPNVGNYCYCWYPTGYPPGKLYVVSCKGPCQYQGNSC